MDYREERLMNYKQEEMQTIRKWQWEWHHGPNKVETMGLGVPGIMMLVGIILLFIVAPLGIALFIAGIWLDRVITDKKIAKWRVANGCEGKNKYSFVDGLEKNYKVFAAEIRECNRQEKIKRLQQLEELEREIQMYEKNQLM